MPEKKKKKPAEYGEMCFSLLSLEISGYISFSISSKGHLHTAHSAGFFSRKLKEGRKIVKETMSTQSWGHLILEMSCLKFFKANQRSQCNVCYIFAGWHVRVQHSGPRDGEVPSEHQPHPHPERGGYGRVLARRLAHERCRQVQAAHRILGALQRRARHNRR